MHFRVSVLATATLLAAAHAEDLVAALKRDLQQHNEDYTELRRARALTRPPRSAPPQWEGGEGQSPSSSSPLASSAPLVSATPEPVPKFLIPVEKQPHVGKSPPAALRRTSSRNASDAGPLEVVKVASWYPSVTTQRLKIINPEAIIAEISVAVNGVAPIIAKKSVDENSIRPKIAKKSIAENGFAPITTKKTVHVQGFEPIIANKFVDVNGMGPTIVKKYVHRNGIRPKIAKNTIVENGIAPITTKNYVQVNGFEPKIAQKILDVNGMGPTIVKKYVHRNGIRPKFAKKTIVENGIAPITTKNSVQVNGFEPIIAKKIVDVNGMEPTIVKKYVHRNGIRPIIATQSAVVTTLTTSRLRGRGRGGARPGLDPRLNDLAPRERFLRGKGVEKSLGVDSEYYKDLDDLLKLRRVTKAAAARTRGPVMRASASWKKREWVRHKNRQREERERGRVRWSGHKRVRGAGAGELDAQLPAAEVLDMAPAVGARIYSKRLRHRLCSRQVLNPEGPKYDSMGQVYLQQFSPRGRGHFGFSQTREPRVLLPRCCNCCKKSVLGCE